MENLILVLHMLVSAFLIGAVLLQAGKGASIGATFGGSNQPLYGSSQGSFIGKTTAAAAIVFMLTSLSLAYIASTSYTSSVMSDVKAPPAQVQTQDIPAGEPVEFTEEAFPPTEPSKAE